MRSILTPLLIAAAAAIGAVPALADVSQNPLRAPTGKYTLDPNHTLVTFCIKHMGVSTYCARFNATSGEAVFNGSQPEKSSVKAVIDTASIDTTNDKLDDELRTNFFETAKFPTATFASTAIKVTGKTTADITGNLTLHGVTKPVTLKTTFNGGREHPLSNAYMLGFGATTTLKHADFSFPDVAWGVFVGDDVSLSIAVEMRANQ